MILIYFLFSLALVIVELLIRFYFTDADSLEDDATLFYETTIDLSKLFRMENFSLNSLSTIPRNSIFLWVDDKAVLMESSLYIALRKSKQIKARTGSMATIDDKIIESFSAADMEENAGDGILNEMNSILVDEDEKNIALREDIEVGTGRVASLRSEAESLLCSMTTDMTTPSSNPREPSAALRHLELQQVSTSFFHSMWCMNMI
jgi:hypothetical protein